MHHTTRNYIIPISLGSILAIAAFISVLLFVDPYNSGAIPHIFFYLTLFLACTGLFTLGGILLRKRFSPGMFSEKMRSSTRQAILLSILVVGLILFQVFNVLFWWVGITFILFIITLEIFLSS